MFENKKGRAIRHYAFAPAAHSLALLVLLAAAFGVATIPSHVISQGRKYKLSLVLFSSLHVLPF